ncbi:MAG TPA: alanine racemase [Thermomicrobiaceae bacterium]|nr:alanine racemase [Thermomicrobiaceae bacterium]
MTFDRRLSAAQAATHAVIDLDALAGNAIALRRLLPKGAGLMAVVKANAYGHGLVPAARAFLAAGASWLGVARIEEGLALRDAGITAPILVLGPPNPLLAEAAARSGLSLAVGSVDGLRRLVEQLPPDLPSQLPVHLKVDTGMHRFGVQPDDAAKALRSIVSDAYVRKYVQLEGIFTHFATADEPGSNFAEVQAERFSATLRQLAEADLLPDNVYVHMANSAGSLRGLVDPGISGAHVLARAGIALYGLEPSPAMPLPEGCRPALRLYSRVAHELAVPAGEGISYGLTYRPERNIRCVVLPAGYGDGVSRLLSNQGWALIDGRRCPIRGRVCMDQLVVETGEGGSVTPSSGTLATLIGDGSDEAMTAGNVARLCGTINYEVVTAISARVPRVYLRDGRPVAVADLLGTVEDDGPAPSSPLFQTVGRGG